jgi:hypothetical protein
MRGVVPKEPFIGVSLWNHPSRDPLRDPAALLTKEGNPLTLQLLSMFGGDETLR